MRNLERMLALSVLLFAGELASADCSWTDERGNLRACTPGSMVSQATRTNLLQQQTATPGIVARVPIRFEGGVIRLEVKINGQTFPAVLDTGASNSSVPAHLAAVLQLPKMGETKLQTSGGIISTQVVLVRALGVGSLSVRDLDVTVTQGYPGVLLGMDFLSAYRFTIDPRGGELVLTR